MFIKDTQGFYVSKVSRSEYQLGTVFIFEL